MTPTKAARAIAVVKAETIISQRTRVTVALRSLAGSGCADDVLADDLCDTFIFGMTLTMTTRSLLLRTRTPAIGLTACWQRMSPNCRGLG